MLHLLEQILHIISMNQSYIRLRLENRSDEAEYEKLVNYAEHEQKQYHLWQYVYFLVKGASFSPKKHVQLLGNVEALLLFHEMKKALLYYELVPHLSGAQKWAAEQALTKALEHSLFFSNLTRR
ncbi:MAG: hypothetical protein K6T72_10065 [Anoxybacillus sp.]|nr:hypothetical protein [Anoxybacillus sp.]MCL6586838.1 hypothetical protein [Anoxybacillus sp.]